MSDLVTVEQEGPLLLIGVNRADKRNAWNLEIIQAVLDIHNPSTELLNSGNGTGDTASDVGQISADLGQLGLVSQLGIEVRQLIQNRSDFIVR